MSNFFHGKMFAKISELDEAIEFDTADEFVVVKDRITQKISGLGLTESIVSIGNLASKAYVDAVVDGAPELLNTLNEIAAALNDDSNFASNIINSIATKLPTANFGLEFWSALEGVTTFNIAEDSNLYYTQARFDSAFADKTTTALAEGDNLYWTQARFDSALGSKSTSDTSEGSNLYYTQARFDAALAAKTTADVAEGSNLYYTQARFDAALAAKTTTALVEGDNLYWTQARFDAALGSKSTSDTSEGNNLYYTQARFDSALAAKTTADVAEGANLYFTEQRVLDIIATQTTNKLVNGSVEVVLQSDGTVVLPADPTSDNHAATKGYVDNQLNSFESFSGSYNDLTDKPTAPTYTSVTTTDLNVQNVTFTGSGPVSFTSGNDLNFVATGTIAFNSTVSLGADGKLTLLAEPTSDNHAATKGYVDNQVDYIVAGQGFATLGYVEDAIGDALDNYKSDRLVSGSKEVVLQSNGYIRLVNGAQLYDYGSGTGNGYGITDAASGTYIGYDPSDTLGALHMDSYTGGNIRIRTTTLPNTYKDWLFESNGALTLPAVPTSTNHAATKGYVDDAIVAAELDGGEF